jgi:alpha-beta hydrolase superfamily lysophospholipase
VTTAPEAGLPQSHSWQPSAPGAQPRGTVILLPGRGEHGGVYERLGRRLAFDAYALHALDVTVVDDPDVLAKQITAVLAHAVTPVVLAGSDTGALQALSLVASSAVTVDGLLLAGLPSVGAASGVGPASALDAGPGPGPGPGTDTDTVVGPATTTALDDESAWDDELAVRTACPVHRGRLTEDPHFIKGSLTEPIPSHLNPLAPELDLEGLHTPVLLLHGGSDPVAPLNEVRQVAARLPKAELAVTNGGRHDVLNDAPHRTVAAQIVQWLERLRSSPQLTPLIAVEDPTLAPQPTLAAR